ncbi:uncharacterized protein J3D65DRAFT_622725 [Phyllosticta citribraziliensis]|uniref:Secreted protein n=1 Tax=Phyllosticta citribraziliensis TaxID=989973 RepID=A0ABR1LU41_9PEZI
MVGFCFCRRVCFLDLLLGLCFFWSRAWTSSAKDSGTCCYYSASICKCLRLGWGFCRSNVTGIIQDEHVSTGQHKLRACRWVED